MDPVGQPGEVAEVGEDVASRRGRSPHLIARADVHRHGPIRKRDADQRRGRVPAGNVGEVVRLHLVDTANTRIFNFGISGARMKLVRRQRTEVEREEFVDEILLSPSERAIVDVPL